MSIQDALLNATQTVLSSYLASDLVAQLSQEIVELARTDIETALQSFIGFELGKPLISKGKAGIKNSRRKKDHTPLDNQDSSENDTDSDDVLLPAESLS